MSNKFTKEFLIVIEPDEGGFHVFVPALPGCHSFGETVEEARKNIVELLIFMLKGWLKMRRSFRS